MKKRVLFVIALIGFAIVISCEYKKGLLPKRAAVTLSPETCDTITYTKHIRPILITSCISCHSGPAPSAMLDLSVYANARAIALNGSLKDRAILGNGPQPMPTSGLLPQPQLDLFQCWINNGGLQ